MSGPNIVGTQTAVTNEHGFYRFLNLPPGEYQLSLHPHGLQELTRRGIRVSVGGTLEENAALEMTPALGVGRGGGRVLGRRHDLQRGRHQLRPRAGSRTPRCAATASSTWSQSAPGSLAGGDSNNTSRTMVYGSSYDENSFQVDGVDITDNYFNEALAEPNTDAIEEVEILSLGAPAEYGNLTGAVYNIVTRQGTNEFHGDLGFYCQSRRPDLATTRRASRNPDGSFLDACPDGEARCPWTRDKLHRLQRAARRARSSRTSSGSSPPTRTSATTTGTSASTPPTRSTAVREPHRPLLRQAELADQPQAQAGRHLPPGRPRTTTAASRSTRRPRRPSRGPRRRPRPASATRASCPTRRSWRSATRASTAT